jgi:hypothetical protein
VQERGQVVFGHGAKHAELGVGQRADGERHAAFRQARNQAAFLSPTQTFRDAGSG